MLITQLPKISNPNIDSNSAFEHSLPVFSPSRVTPCHSENSARHSENLKVFSVLHFHYHLVRLICE